MGIDKVVARSAGDASYLRCVASESADVETDPSEVIAGSQVRVRTGKHAGVSGTVEGVVNGWVRLRTDDGEVLASRGRRSVEVVDLPQEKETQKSPLASLLKTLEQTTGELGELVKRLDVRTKKTLQDSIGIEKVTFEETVTELPLPRREKQLLELLKEVAALQRKGRLTLRCGARRRRRHAVERRRDVAGLLGRAGVGRAAEVACGSARAVAGLSSLDGKVTGGRHGRGGRFRHSSIVRAAARSQGGTHNAGRSRRGRLGARACRKTRTTIVVGRGDARRALRRLFRYR